jgi:hypothetical protein
LLLGALALPTPTQAESALPSRDLIVELREAAGAGGTTGWEVNSADAARGRVAQRLRVRNGHSASLSLSVTRPVQTWQVLPGVWRGVAAPATQWISAGQALVVQPRWPGGARPVDVTLRAQSARFDASVALGSAEPPQRGEVQLETTVSVPLGEWVTLATSGDAPAHSVSSRDASSARRILQLRIGLAP